MDLRKTRIRDYVVPLGEPLVELLGAGFSANLAVDGRLVAVLLQPTIEAKVVECEPHMKGQSSGMKDAILENGVQVKVATMVSPGDRVLLDSETMEFKERVT